MDDFKRETVTMYAASTRRTRGLSGPWSALHTGTAGNDNWPDGCSNFWEYGTDGIIRFVKGGCPQRGPNADRDHPWIDEQGKMHLGVGDEERELQHYVTSRQDKYTPDAYSQLKARLAYIQAQREAGVAVPQQAVLYAADPTHTWMGSAGNAAFVPAGTLADSSTSGKMQTQIGPADSAGIKSKDDAVTPPADSNMPLLIGGAVGAFLLWKAFA